MSDGLDLRDRPPAGQEASDSDIPRVIGSSYTKPDRFYRGTASGAGIITLVLLVLIGTFLLIRAWPALSSQGFGFLTNTAWHPEQNPPVFGIAAVLYWTIVIAFIAMLIAVPMSILAALALTEYAPMRLRKPLTSLVDLLAAIPSLIYGLWGLFFLQEKLVPLAEWISSFFGWIPIFAVEGEQFTQSSFMAGVVVALMVLPVTTSVMREVFSQAPPGEKEAALALGSTRWGMIRTVVLPFGRGGIIGGSMLGLGRALGETIAVALIISPIFEINLNWLHTGSNSVASLIALRFGEANEAALAALMAAGLSLFVLTLVVNMLASRIVSRSRSGSGVDL